MPGLHSVGPFDCAQGRLFGAGQPRALSPPQERRSLLERHSASSSHCDLGDPALTSLAVAGHFTIAHMKEKNACGDSDIDGVATAPHGNANREIRRFDELAGEAALFASN